MDNGILQEKGHAVVYEQECYLYSGGNGACHLLLIYVNIVAKSKKILLFHVPKGEVNHFFCASFQRLYTKSTKILYPGDTTT